MSESANDTMTKRTGQTSIPNATSATKKHRADANNKVDLPPTKENILDEINLNPNYDYESNVSSMPSTDQANNMKAPALVQENARIFLNGIYMRATDSEGKTIYVPEENALGGAMLGDSGPRTINALGKLFTVIEQKLNRTCDSEEVIKKEIDNVHMEVYKNAKRVDNVNRQLSDLRNTCSSMSDVNRQLSDLRNTCAAMSETLKLIHGLKISSDGLGGNVQNNADNGGN